jgi:hypothetical protein
MMFRVMAEYPDVLRAAEAMSCNGHGTYVDDLLQHMATLQNEVSKMQKTLSWRITSPLRWIVAAIHRIGRLGRRNTS